MGLEENKALAHRYSEAWASRDLTVFEALLAPDFVDFMMGRRRTRDELLRDAATPSLANIEQRIDAMVAEDDKVAVTYTTTATAGEKPLSFTGMFILTIAGGKVTGGWGEFDRLGIREQLASTAQ